MSNSRRWLERVRAWSRLPPGERRLHLELAGELVRARLQVSLLPDRAYARALGPPLRASDSLAPDFARPSTETLRLLDSVRGATESLSRGLPWNCTCLMQALAARRVLRRRGCPTQLRLGVRKSGSRMEAHAWLMHGDCVVTGDSQVGFSPLALFDGMR